MSMSDARQLEASYPVYPMLTEATRRSLLHAKTRGGLDLRQFDVTRALARRWSARFRMCVCPWLAPARVILTDTEVVL